MAEAVVISVVGGLVKILWDKIQKAKDISRDTDFEFQLLKDFMEQLNTFSKISGSHSSTDKGTNLRKALAQAETKLQLWCSKKSGFLLRSSDERNGELKFLRQSLETALEFEKLRLQQQHNQIVESMIRNSKEQGQAKNPPKKDPEPSPGTQKTAPSKGKPSGSQMSTKIEDKDQSKRRSKSADRGKRSKARIPDSPSQLPPKAHSSSRTRSSSADSTRNQSTVADGKKSPTSRSTKVDRAGNQSSNKDGKTHKQQSWQYLWVPMDSEFQADEMKKRLEGVQGVKRVTCDQPSQKVSVLRREVSHVRTDALLEHARQANPLKRNPTRWADRPR